MELKATLNTDEITKAITEYVGNQGFDLDGKNVNIEMVTTRKPKGFAATVTIGGTPQTKPTKNKPATDEEIIASDPVTQDTDTEVATQEEENLFGSDDTEVTTVEDQTEDEGKSSDSLFGD